MKQTLKFTLILAIIGFFIGYAMFGKMGGEYLSFSTIFGISGGKLESFGRGISGINSIRNSILISTGVGAVIALLYTYLKKM